MKHWIAKNTAGLQQQPHYIKAYQIRHQRKYQEHKDGSLKITLKIAVMINHLHCLKKQPAMKGKKLDYKHIVEIKLRDTANGH